MPTVLKLGKHGRVKGSRWVPEPLTEREKALVAALGEVLLTLYKDQPKKLRALIAELES